MFPRLAGRVVCCDLETTGLSFVKDKIFGVAIGFKEEGAIKSHYFDVREQPKTLEWLADELPRTKMLVNHNVKFDLHFLAKAGVVVPPEITRCTMLRASLIDEHLLEYGLDPLSERYLGERKEQIYAQLAEMFGGKPTRNAQMKNLPRAPRSIVAKYAIKDGELPLKLYDWQEAEIERQGLQDIVNFEQSVFPELFEMEHRGVAVDVAAAERAMHELRTQSKEIVKRLSEMAGFPVNPNPSGSLTKLFAPKYDTETGRWYAIDGTLLSTTKAGKASLNAEALREMKHPAAAMVLEARQMNKLAETFLAGHVLGHQIGGRVYPNINQTKGGDYGDLEGTSTGRFSYTEPALQQIPSRDKATSSVIKAVFLPDEGMMWASGDLSQHEYRIFAHYVANPDVLSQYRKNPYLDLHTQVAELTGLPRSATHAGEANAKQLNLGMVFCMGGGTLAEMMGLPYTEEEVRLDGEMRTIKKPGPEAKEIIERYHELVPGVREVARKAIAVAKERGYVRTIMGRHIRFPGKKYTHKASGLIYQGSSADLNKANFRDVAAYLRSLRNGSRMLLNVHDSYEIQVPKEGWEPILKECKRIVQHKPDLRVPIIIDFTRPARTYWESTSGEEMTRGWPIDKNL